MLAAAPATGQILKVSAGHPPCSGDQKGRGLSVVTELESQTLGLSQQVRGGDWSHL